MKEKKPDYCILASWWLRPMPMGDVLIRIRRYMEGLRSIHPIFEHWMITEDNGRLYKRLQPDWSNLEDIVYRAIVYRALSPEKSDIHRHTLLDKNNELASSFISRFGFWPWFHTCHAHLEKRPPFPRRGGVTLTIDAVGTDMARLNSVALDLPTNQYGELHEPQMVRRLLDWTVQVWRPTSCEVRSTDFIDTCKRIQGFRWRKLDAAWMNYIHFPLLRDCLPTDLPCEHEALPDGGDLFRLTPLPPDPKNLEHLERARRLQSIFDSLHLCDSEYVLNGWPHDPAEIKYKAQITGAPEDRKYAVKMALFDGYDAERKVLLYAMLLNTVEYALDVDEYGRIKFPLRAYDAQINPCVVEACRQLDAVKMAGGGNYLIEWHIGIEENARRLAAIFKFAGIDESRLRVRYTPFIGSLEDS